MLVLDGAQHGGSVLAPVDRRRCCHVLVAPVLRLASLAQGRLPLAPDAATQPVQGLAQNAGGFGWCCALLLSGCSVCGCHGSAQVYGTELLPGQVCVGCEAQPVGGAAGGVGSRAPVDALHVVGPHPVVACQLLCGHTASGGGEVPGGSPAVLFNLSCTAVRSICRCRPHPAARVSGDADAFYLRVVLVGLVVLHNPLPVALVVRLHTPQCTAGLTCGCVCARA